MQGSAKNDILATLCLVSDGERGRELFQFVSAEDRKELDRIALSFLSETGLDRKKFVARLRSLKRIKQFSALEEIHPGWLLERLKGESPRVLGLLCRFLSGEKVRYLISHLAPQDRLRLPSLGESYGVSSETADVVLSLIDRKWSLPLPPQGESFSFAHLVWMKADDLKILFRDLGLEEIGKAFDSVDPSVLKVFLTRFPMKGAQEVRERIDGCRSVSPMERKEAQGHLVAISLDRISADEMFREIGFSAFSRSLSEDQKPWAELVAEKGAPEEGYRLKRMIREAAGSAPESVLRQRQEGIVRRVRILAKEGRIRRYWKEETPPISHAA